MLRPCFIEPYEALVKQAAEVVAVFFNPNIHPAEEYERRRETMLGYARSLGSKSSSCRTIPPRGSRAPAATPANRGNDAASATD